MSYNESDARFCSQCGVSLAGGAASAASSSPRSRSVRIPRILLFLVIIGAGVAGGLYLFQLAGPSVLSGAGDGSDASAGGGGLGATGGDAATANDPGSSAGSTAGQPAPTSAGDREVSLSPEALLREASESLYLFVGLDASGDEAAACASVETADGLATCASALPGTYQAWVQNQHDRGYEIERILYFDALLGGAVLEPGTPGRALPFAALDQLAMGDRLFLMRPGRSGAPPSIVPGLYGGGTYAPTTGAERLLFSGPPPGDLGAVVIDEHGRFVGLAAPKGDGPVESARNGADGAFAFIPSSLFRIGGQGAPMSLRDLNAIYYEGTYTALLRRARSLLQKNRLGEALTAFDAARDKDPERGRDLDPEVLNLTLNHADELLRARRPAEALALLTDKVLEFPQSVDLLVLAFRAAGDNDDLFTALGWMDRIAALDGSTYGKLQAEHVALYLGWADQLYKEGQRREAIKVLLEGIDLRPRNPDLRESLGNLLQISRDYRGAALAFEEAIRNDPVRERELRPKIDLCVELQSAPGVVAIDFDPRDHIVSQALLNGRVWVEFIVDTGASYSSIPQAAAEALGIDVRRIQQKARVTTANGTLEVPYFVLDSIDLAGFVVKDSFALVNDLPAPDSHFGLLGLNFLNQFHYTVDHQSGRMVLRRK